MIDSPEQNRRYRQKPVQRREFLKQAGRAAAGIATAIAFKDKIFEESHQDGILETGATESNAPESIVFPDTELNASPDVISRVVNYEEELGRGTLSIEQAQGYVPLLSELFADATKSEFSAEEYANRTFVFQAGTVEEGIDPSNSSINDLMNVSFVKELLLRYPELELTEKTVRSLVHSAFYTSFGARPAAFTYDGKVFINLTEVVPNHSPAFADVEERTECSIALPAEFFRSVVLHELTHLDADMATENKTPKPITEEAAATFTNGRYSSDNLFYNGFAMRVQLNDKTPNVTPFAAMEEITAFYIASRISRDNGMNFLTSDIYTPNILSNYRAILGSSGIDTKSLYDLHHSSDFEGLMERLVNNANILNEEKDLPVFSREIAKKIFLAFESGIPPKLDELKENYKGIKDQDVKYWPSKLSTFNEGCLNPSPYLQEKPEVTK